MVQDGSLLLADAVDVKWNDVFRPDFLEWPALYSQACLLLFNCTEMRKGTADVQVGRVAAGHIGATFSFCHGYIQTASRTRVLTSLLRCADLHDAGHCARVAGSRDCAAVNLHRRQTRHRQVSFAV